MGMRVFHHILHSQKGEEVMLPTMYFAWLYFVCGFIMGYIIGAKVVTSYVKKEKTEN